MPSGHSPRCPPKRRLGGSECWYGQAEEQKGLSFQPGIERRVCSLVTSATLLQVRADAITFRCPQNESYPKHSTRIHVLPSVGVPWNLSRKFLIHLRTLLSGRFPISVKASLLLDTQDPTACPSVKNSFENKLKLYLSAPELFFF